MTRAGSLFFRISFRPAAAITSSTSSRGASRVSVPMPMASVSKRTVTTYGIRHCANLKQSVGTGNLNEKSTDSQLSGCGYVDDDKRNS